MWVAKTRNPRFIGVLLLATPWNVYLLTWALFLRGADPAILTDLTCLVMAAIISTALVAPNQPGWLLLTVLATISIGTLKNGINSIKN